MRNIKYILVLAMVFAFQFTYSQGCEGPGEGDGINFFGFIQPQFEYVNNEVNSKYNTNLPDDTSGFFFNRARLGVMGNIPYDFSYYFIVEYAPAAGFGICDAFVSYNRFAPYMSAAVGQFKVPFGAEQLQGCHKLYTIDRSMVSGNIGAPIRDVGLMLSGGSGDKIKLGENGPSNVIGYQLAYMNGEGRDLISNEEPLAGIFDKYSIYAGRLTFTPSKHFTLGGGFKYGKGIPSSDVVEYDEKIRYGIDGKLDYKNFILQAEYLYGKDKGSIEKIVGEGCGATVETVPGSDSKDGFYVTALYKTKWNLEPVVKFESFDTSLNTDDDKVMRWTTGINYFFNEWTRLQVNYQYNLTEAPIPAGDFYHDTVQIQLQAIIK